MITQSDMAEFKRSLLRWAALLLVVQTAIWTVVFTVLLP
jgi:hypothetical protein